MNRTGPFNLLAISIKPILPHMVFLIFRIILFAIILVNFNNIKLFSHKIYVNSFGDLAFLILFNIFQFFILVQSHLYSNIMIYYITMIVMLHNMTITITILIFTGCFLSLKCHYLLITVFILYLVELIHSVCVKFTSKFILKFDLFNKIGANPKINDAFTKRKGLLSLGNINVFISSILIFKNIFFNSYREKTAYYTYLQGLLAYLLQIIIFVHSDQEKKIQRGFAILISFIRVYLLGFVVLDHLYVEKEVEKFALNGISFVSLLICTLFHLYFLIADTKRFGSGLESFLLFRTARITL